jgi:hypothetical protein
MIVLTTSINDQTFACVPRSKVFDELVLTDDQTNDSVSITDFTITDNDYYVTVEAEFTLVENHFYDLVIKDGSTIVFKDRIFCTNQNIAQFSVNNGQYVSNTTGNTFIVYE